MLQIMPHQQLSAEAKAAPSDTRLGLYLLETAEDRPFVLVLPGGGYNHLAAHEGAPVAQWLNAQGYHAGVLYYQVTSLDYRELLADIDSLLSTLLTQAPKWRIQPHGIGAIGFSAGGHLAATIGTHFETLAFMLLAYPVITFQDPYAHLGSRRQFLGSSPSAEELQDFSNELRVTATTPPTFIWHTANDPSVPVQNSLLFCEALIAHQVPVACHILPDGRHGLGLAQGTPCHIWTHLGEQWLKKITTDLGKELP